GLERARRGPLIDGVEGRLARGVVHALVPRRELEGARPIGLVEIALRRIARIPIDVGAHGFALAREVELLFRAKALVRRRAEGARRLPRHERARLLAATIRPLEAIHAVAEGLSTIGIADDRLLVLGALV